MPLQGMLNHGRPPTQGVALGWYVKPHSGLMFAITRQLKKCSFIMSFLIGFVARLGDNSITFNVVFPPRATKLNNDHAQSHNKKRILESIAVDSDAVG